LFRQPDLFVVVGVRLYSKNPTATEVVSKPKRTSVLASFDPSTSVALMMSDVALLGIGRLARFTAEVPWVRVQPPPND
jgi:hypothetical protein